MNRKFIAIIITLLIAVVLAATFYFTRSEPNLLTDYGSISIDRGRITISMTDDEPGLSIERQLSGYDWGFISSKTSSSISPSSWTNHRGFFSYVDSTGKVWSYNGKDRSFIYEILPDGSGRSWDLSTWPHEVPIEVSSRITNLQQTLTEQQ